MNLNHTPTSHQQSGVVLIEAMVAIVIFSISLLGLMGIQSNAIGMSIDAKYRADAAYLANQIISQMWVDRANLATYAHYSTGDTTCSPSGTPSGSQSANTKVYNGSTSGSWIYQVGNVLPGATSAKQQIILTASGTSQQVLVCLRWKRPEETNWHSHVTVAQINQ